MNKFRKKLLGDFKSLGISFAGVLIAITFGVVLSEFCISGQKSSEQNIVSLEIVPGRVEFEKNDGSLILMAEKVTPKYDVPLEDDLCLYTEELCDELGVPARVIYAMMYVESQYQPDIVNDAGDSGLLQLSNTFADFYAQEYGVTNLLDPKGNILCGTSLLASYLEKYSLSDALMAYNCGPNRAAELWAQGIHSTDYTEKVLTAMECIQERSEPNLYYLCPLTETIEGTTVQLKLESECNTWDEIQQ